VYLRADGGCVWYAVPPPHFSISSKFQPPAIRLPLRIRELKIGSCPIAHGPMALYAHLSLTWDCEGVAIPNTHSTTPQPRHAIRRFGSD